MKLQPLVEFPIMTSTLPVCPTCKEEIQEDEETIEKDGKIYHSDCVKLEPAFVFVQDGDE